MNELKLYSTIDCHINHESILSRKAADYTEIILRALDGFDKGSSQRGLMDYIYDDELNKKILFAKVCVEKISNELFAVFRCTLKTILTDEEIESLKNECAKLYSGIWGKGFHQIDINIPGSEDILNVNFFFRHGDFFQKHNEIVDVETEEELREALISSNNIEYFAFQHIDFEKTDIDLSKKKFNNCLFLGCNIPEQILEHIGEDCHVYSNADLPFNPFINTLYTRDNLFEGYVPGIPVSYEDTPDKKIYNHYIINGKKAFNIKETLFRRLHDHSITNAMNDLLNRYNERYLVAVMGGHNLKRGDSDYVEVVKISKKLTELGYLMLSGGGPGAMEATHVGAWLAGKPEMDIHESINILSQAPTYEDDLWLDKAYEVLSLFPSSEYESLGIPTWLYGHEPPTPFASKIAKYFANSVREDGLLTIAKGGIIFAPGNAGTIQEVFQEATQNHYLSFGYASPMVFLNTNYWTNSRPIFPLLKKMIDQEKYKNMIISTYDTEDNIVKEIRKFTHNQL